MEPSTTAGRQGTLENPEVREDVPGHIIPIIEREFDDFDTESQRFLRGDIEETEFIKFRLKQGVYGQRQADVQMIRVKLPVRRHHARAARRLRRRHREVRAAEQGPHHDAPEHPAAPRPAARRRGGDPRAVRRRPVLARGLRQHRAQRHRRPVGGRLRGRGLRPHALRRRLRALLRAPPDDADDAAQDQDGVRRRARRRPLADRHPRHRLPRPRARRRARRRGARRRRHVDHAARRADALRVRRPRRRRVPQGRRGRASGSSTARTSCASTAPARASRCSSTRSASTPSARWSTRSCAGDWVAERDFDVAGLRFDVDEEALAPRAAADVRLARTATWRQFERFVADNVAAAAPARLLDRPRQGHPRRPDARAAARHRARSCATTRGGFMRTTVHQNFLLRWVRDETVYEVWQRARRARPRRRRPGHDHRRRLVPGHGLLQARHHVARWASTPRCSSASRRCRSPIR